ncbi:TPA_asm: P [Lupinus gammacytorhabdovirus 1]|nr:TPA_asm: P [Lupinus gammacytorhabdovirus 1]
MVRSKSSSEHSRAKNAGKLLSDALSASKPALPVSTPGSSIASQALKSVTMANEGQIHELFQEVHELAVDPTSPVAPDSATADALAANIVAGGKVTQVSRFQLDKKSIGDQVLREAVDMGVLVDSPHLDDIYAACNAAARPLNTFEIRLYLKGVARANQLSVVNTLVSVVKNLEAVVTKTQGVMNASVEGTKIVSEKLISLGSKMDNMVPSISSSTAYEVGKARSDIKTLTDIVTASSHIPSLKAGSSSLAPTQVSHDMIVNMCLSMKMPEHKAKTVAEKYGEFINWDIYNKIMAGEINVAGFRVLLTAWQEQLG